jgi:hypothetical protein
MNFGRGRVRYEQHSCSENWFSKSQTLNNVVIESMSALSIRAYDGLKYIFVDIIFKYIFGEILSLVKKRHSERQFSERQNTNKIA